MCLTATVGSNFIGMAVFWAWEGIRFVYFSLQENTSVLYQSGEKPSFELAKLSVTNLIGPFQCDQHMVRPCTFQDLPPFSSNTFYGLFTADVSSVATGQQLISFHLMLQQMHQLCFQLYICRANRGVCF